jgi:hypothetical protein
MEEDMVAKVIHPFSLECPERSKNWFFGHGGSLELETGAPVGEVEIRVATQRLSHIVEASTYDAFQPIRENDELMYALQTPEHPGQTQGKWLISWWYGFPENVDTYRSHLRWKDEEAERIRRL